MNIGGRLVAVVDATQLNRVLRGLRQSHTGATLAENTLIGDLVLLRFATKLLGRDFLELLLRVHRRRVCGPCHRVSCLAAAGHAGEGKVLSRVTPHNIALFPWHTENFSARAVYVDYRLRSQVADPRLEGDPPIRFNNYKSVTPNSPPT